MLNDTDKILIESGFNRIKKYIDDISEAISLFKTYETKILALTRIKNSPSYAKELKILFSKQSVLEDIIKIFNTPQSYDNINQQYETFLKGDIATIKLDHYPIKDKYYYKLFADLDNLQLDNITAFETRFHYTISDILNFPNTIINYIDSLTNLACSLSIYSKIKNLDNNIIMIGANGSGKSTLARELKGKFSQNTVIISAQHILHYKNSNVVYGYDKTYEEYHNWASNDKLFSKGNYDSHDILSDMEKVIERLKSEHNDCMSDYYNNETNKQESVLYKTMKLWHKLLKHRSLKYDSTRLYATDNINDYEFDFLSDGEKAVFYYIANVLLASENSYIIIDEPENHLHLNLCLELWNELELARPDCKYIYLTHNCELAATRTNATIIWNKKFIPPYTWDFQIIEDNETIPSKLMIEILGTRKPICFCEGTFNSIDHKLYSILFPEYSFSPVGGHLDVVNYVKAYNKISGRLNDAIGIIDKDYHSSSQIEDWQKNHIYSLPVNEVENILVDQYLLEKMIAHHHSSKDSLKDFQEAFWKKLTTKKEQLATSYINEYTNNLLKANLVKERLNVDILIQEINNTFDPDKIRNKYNETLNKINTLIKNNDYKNAVAFVNFKNVLTKELANRHIVDNYVDRVLAFIQERHDIKEFILKKYFQPLLDAMKTK